MKTSSRKLVAALLALAPAMLSVEAVGIPEPALVLYGSVTNTAGPLLLMSGGVNWAVVVGGFSASVSSTIASVNGQFFYVARIPFETRFAGNLTFNPATNTLPLTASPTAFTRSATVDGVAATLVPPASTNFTFNKADRGRVEQVNLVVNLPPETFAQWSQRIFGTSSIDPNADPDHDGANNMAEYLAGTDPLNAESSFKLISIQPAQPSGIAIQWLSVIGKTYTIQRSTTVDSNYLPLGAPILATNVQTSFSDTSATGPGPYFYRLLTQ